MLRARPKSARGRAGAQGGAGGSAHVAAGGRHAVPFVGAICGLELQASARTAYCRCRMSPARAAPATLARKPCGDVAQLCSMMLAAARTQSVSVAGVTHVANPGGAPGVKAFLSCPSVAAPALRAGYRASGPATQAVRHATAHRAASPVSRHPPALRGSRRRTAAQVAVDDAARVQERHAGSNLGRGRQHHGQVALALQAGRLPQEGAAPDGLLRAARVGFGPPARRLPEHALWQVVHRVAATLWGQRRGATSSPCASRSSCLKGHHPAAAPTSAAQLAGQLPGAGARQRRAGGAPAGSRGP